MSSAQSSSSNTIKIKKRKAVTDALLESFASLLGREPSTLSASGSTGDLLSKITIKDIRKSKKVGSGGFGDVLLVEHPRIGKVALKRLQLSRCSEDAEDQRRRALREGQIWADLKHKNILPCLGVLEAAGSIFLVSPFVPRGNLSQYIQTDPERDRIPWIVQIAEAMAFLHSNGIVHGDLKAANVLISDEIEALLCDFGLAKAASADTSIGLEGQGSVRWESIELLEKGHGKTFASDVWAFGMVIYEILSGLLPYHTYTTNHAVIKAIVVKHELPPEQPATSPTCRSYERLWQATRLCWKEIPEERCTMDVARSTVRPAAGWAASVITAGWTSDVAVSPVGNLVAYVSSLDSGYIRDLNLTVRCLEPGLETIHTAPATWQAFSQLSFSPDGRLLLLQMDKSCRLWDTQTWAETDIPYPREDECKLAFPVSLWSHDSTTCVVSDNRRGLVWVLDTLALKINWVGLPIICIFKCLGITRHHLYISRNEHISWNEGPKKSHSIWDVSPIIPHVCISTWDWRNFTRDHPIQEFKVQFSHAHELHFVPARNAVLGYGDQTLTLWSVPTGELLWTNEISHSAPVGWHPLDSNFSITGLRTTPNGKTFAILYMYSLTRKIVVFDTTTDAIISSTTIDAIGPEMVQDLHLLDGKQVLVGRHQRDTTSDTKIWVSIKEYKWE